MKGAEMIGRSTLFIGLMAAALPAFSGMAYSETVGSGIFETLAAQAPAAETGLKASAEKADLVKGHSAKSAPTSRRTLQADSGSAATYRPMIARHAAANGVPFALADAVVRVESRYNPSARNGPSLGLAQINLRTAKGLGYNGSAQGLLNAETNLTYAMKYLGQAYRMAGGDTCGTIMRYQNGTASRTFTGANRAYCSKVRAHIAYLGGKKQNA